MGVYVQIVLLLLAFVYSGCSSAQLSTQEKNKEKIKKVTPFDDMQTGSSELENYKKKVSKGHLGRIPDLVLPPAYEDISVFNSQKITFSAQNANFSTVLHAISKISGLNLVIDQDINTNKPITISVHEADIEDVLNILMEMSGCYYQLSGNIIHIKEFMSKNFAIPYTHTTTSFKTELGGDVLSSASGGESSSGSGVKGNFSLKFDNPDKINSFYEQLEKNIQTLMSKDGHYTLNKFSGILSVYDKKKNIDALTKVINLIKTQTNRQVLIEAKILEVSLNKNHSLGVSWDAIADNIFRNGDKLNLTQPLALGGAVAGTATYSTKNFSAIINALNEDGDVDTLSNPRIKVLSGQSAIISSGKLIPFWEKEVQTTQGTGGSASNTEVTYTRRDILDGLTMGVTPTILDNGKIMLNVTPITSSIEKTIEHTDEKGAVVASAPIINIKEAGTVIQAKDNDLVLIGGLINNSIQTSEKKVPVLGYIPYLGALFTQEISTKVKKELVILIRLKVIQ